MQNKTLIELIKFTDDNIYLCRELVARHSASSELYFGDYKEHETLHSHYLQKCQIHYCCCHPAHFHHQRFHLHVHQIYHLLQCPVYCIRHRFVRKHFQQQGAPLLVLEVQYRHRQKKCLRINFLKINSIVTILRCVFYLFH